MNFSILSFYKVVNKVWNSDVHPSLSVYLYVALWWLNYSLSGSEQLFNGSTSQCDLTVFRSRSRHPDQALWRWRVFPVWMASGPQQLSQCCESAQCWSSDNVPIVLSSSSSVRPARWETFHLCFLSAHCPRVCLCLTCRWRSPKTKCTWVPTAWCSTCRTKTASSESGQVWFYILNTAVVTRAGFISLCEVGLGIVVRFLY